MENATKAMQIAAGVLMSVLVLGLLVYGYNNITESKDIEQQAVREEQAADFNKSFETYNRDLVGTELIALSNKVDDYNKRYPQSEGYTKIEFSHPVNITTTEYPNYGNSSKTIAKTNEELGKKIDELAKKTKEGNDGRTYTYSEISKLSITKLNNIEIDIGSLTNYDDYVKYVNERKDFARENFECQDWEYDNYGRIKKITFKKK